MKNLFIKLLIGYIHICMYVYIYIFKQNLVIIFKINYLFIIIILNNNLSFTASRDAVFQVIYYY